MIQRPALVRNAGWTGSAIKCISPQTCDEDFPHLITHVETTQASIQDDQVLEAVHQGLAERDVLPEVHLVDAGYTNAEGLVSSQRDYGITLMGPDGRAKAGEGFDKASFLIDWGQETVICPAGKKNYSWLPNGDRSRGVISGVRVQFASRDCTPCPLRAHCTGAKVTPRAWYFRHLHSSVAQGVSSSRSGGLSRKRSSDRPGRRTAHPPSIDQWREVSELDLFSRMVVGWAMGATEDSKLVELALRMALTRRQPPTGLLHHSDRGSEYTSHDYQALLATSGIEVSMSRTANCYDNAVVEAFFGRFKSECINRTHFQSRREARTACFEYLECFYNPIRLHSSLQYMSPVTYEQGFEHPMS